MSRLQNQKVLILGLGISGLSMARWFAAHGALVTVVDTREMPPQLDALNASVPQARFISAPLDCDLLNQLQPDLIGRSPGIAPRSMQALMQAVRARGVPLLGELDLFTQALQDLSEQTGYAPQVIAVTGTNGKTTVTSLTAQLVQRAGLSVIAAGNIGLSLLDALQQCIDSERLPQVWVLELSSFQLEAVIHFEPTVATVLNVTPDHLDWHSELSESSDDPDAQDTAMRAYVAAKAKIFGTRAIMVLNRNDDIVMAMRPASLTESVKRAKRVQSEARAAAVTFGSDAPAAPGDYGIQEVSGMAWLTRAHEADETQRIRKGAQVELHFQLLMPADALRIRGCHNALNALAALALAHAAGCPLAPMLYGLREYRGEPHRVQSIGLIDGVEYFDDSKGTNVGATVAALQGLGGERRLVVILGGDGKGQDFVALRDPIARYARAVVLMGRDAAVIEQVLEVEIPRVRAQTMDQAVALAHQQAHAGDAVLLSPACASLDMFKSYAHRARAFCDAVEAMARERGTELEVPS